MQIYKKKFSSLSLGIFYFRSEPNTKGNKVLYNQKVLYGFDPTNPFQIIINNSLIKGFNTEDAITAEYVVRLSQFKIATYAEIIELFESLRNHKLYGQKEMLEIIKLILAAWDD